MNDRRNAPPKIKKSPYSSRNTGRGQERYDRRKRDNRPMILIAAIIGAVVLLLIIVMVLVFMRPMDATQSDELPNTQGIVSTLLPGTATLTSVDAKSENFPERPVIFVPDPIDVPTLQRYMFNLVNLERQNNGLAALLWDNVAAQAGGNHAAEMTTFQYLSHWNLDGFGPDYRYTQAGGFNIVQENVFSYVHSPGGGPQDIKDWEKIIKDAHEHLTQSPGHRSNILNPAHTHVGIGIAYDSTNGRLSIAQEFVAKYISIQPIPLTATVGQKIELKGKLSPGLANPVINLAYESWPEPKSVDELNHTSTYRSPAKIYEGFALEPDSDGNFTAVFPLSYQNQSGLYHVYIGVDDQYGIGRLILDLVIKVSANNP